MSTLKSIQIQKAQGYAQSRGGTCLSDESEYENSQSRLRWKCSNPDHPAWSGVFHALVSQKSWCPKCKYLNHAKKLSKAKGYENGLDIVNDWAKKRGGKCLSTEYKNSKTLMIWKCHNPKHKPWTAKFNTLKSQETWCMECYKEKKQWGIHKPSRLLEAQNLAAKRHGQCLSTKYINEKHKLEWKCHNPIHKSWMAKFKNILSQDQWCPECAGTKNKTENRVRLFLETGLQFELKSCRPDWNKNPKTGSRLELDGYNSAHKMAFEHDGEHHFKTTLYSPSISDDVLKSQLERDKIKKENCKKEGVTLISIPILDKKFRYQFFHLLRHVVSCCREQGVALKYTYSQIKEMKQKF